MALFDRNPNEKNYVHGQKHFSDVIKNSGPADALVWRQPEEDFNTGSVLIVNPGEQAVFIKNGDIVETFTNGRFTLTTENYPFISRLINAFTGGISSFNCIVVFFSNAVSREIKWGTDSPILVRDQYWGVITNVKARAIYKIRIVNAPLLLSKMIGTNTMYESQEGLYKYFNGTFTNIIKTALSQYLNSLTSELIGLDAHLDEISKNVFPSLQKELELYGIECVQFLLTALDVDHTKYDAIDNSQIDRIDAQRKALSQKDTMDILGKAWGVQQSVDILKGIANNNASSGIIAGVGLGESVSSVLENLSGDYSPNPLESTESQPNQSKRTAKERLLEAKELLELDLITEDEYNQLKHDILLEMRN